MEPQNWLTVDQNYLAEHRVRSQLLRHEKSRVLQCLPESYEACMEMLEEAVEFLCQRFPDLFERMQNGNGNGSRVWNKLTGESFAYGTGDDELDPLEIAVRLSMEDLSVLMKNADDEYYLCVRPVQRKDNILTLSRAASASLFPVGWTVEERIGWTISKLHDPVPLWHQQVANSVSKSVQCRLDIDWTKLINNHQIPRSSNPVHAHGTIELFHRSPTTARKPPGNPLPSQRFSREQHGPGSA